MLAISVVVGGVCESVVLVPAPVLGGPESGVSDADSYGGTIELAPGSLSIVMDVGLSAFEWHRGLYLSPVAGACIDVVGCLVDVVGVVAYFNSHAVGGTTVGVECRWEKLGDGTVAVMVAWVVDYSTEGVRRVSKIGMSGCNVLGIGRIMSLSV